MSTNQNSIARLRFIKAVLFTSFSRPQEVGSFIEMAVYCTQNTTEKVVITWEDMETKDTVTMTVENAAASNYPSFMTIS